MALFSLKNYNAIVTGSSRGIGFSISKHLAEQGANVIISSRRIESCISAADKINEAVGREAAIPIQADIGSQDDILNLAEKSSEALGQINTLICNAATSTHYGPFSDIADDQFRKVLENNILSNHWLIQAVSPHMAKTGDGSILLISSISAFKAYPSMGAYSVSKAAELQLTRCYAQELAASNIRVNAICPGIIETSFAKAALSDEDTRKRLENDALLNRVGQPDEIAGAAIFFASKASSFVTGQSLNIDGGASIT